VKSGDELQKFTEEEIEAIEKGKEERQQAGVREVPFSVGDRVKIVEGLFAPFSGAVEDVSADKKRLKVTVGIFGRPIPVELAFDQVELSDEEE
jgi:transcriptional antiterminator NusG